MKTLQSLYQLNFRLISYQVNLVARKVMDNYYTLMEVVFMKDEVWNYLDWELVVKYLEFKCYMSVLYKYACCPLWNYIRWYNMWLSSKETSYICSWDFNFMQASLWRKITVYKVKSYLFYVHKVMGVFWHQKTPLGTEYFWTFYEKIAGYRVLLIQRYNAYRNLQASTKLCLHKYSLLTIVEFSLN